MNYEIKIVRFELYPRDEPTCYCVGFEGKAANGRLHYVDTQVLLTDAGGLDDDGIVAKAWENVASGFEAHMAVLAAKSLIIGSVFIPNK
jgi:hypothetical protein